MRILRLLSMVVFAAALCFEFVGPARGQSPASEEGQADAQPVGESEASSSPGDDKSATALEAAPPEPPLSESELWAQRLEELIAGLEGFEKDPNEADAFYAELLPILQERRQELREALRWARSPEDLIETTPDEEAPKATQEKQAKEVAEPPLTTVTDAETSTEPPAEEIVSGARAKDPETAAPVDERADGSPESEIADEAQTLTGLYDLVAALYHARIVLLEYVTPELRSKITGVGLTGVRELQGEITQLILDARYKALLIPAQIAAWPGMVQKAPLPLAFGVVEILIALVVFRWWRRWIPGALMRLRDRLMATRPRRRRNLRLARFLWYLDRVRHPIEWLALLAVLFSLIDIPIDQDLEKTPWTVAQWSLLAWFAVALIDSVAARGGASASDKTARLRLGSFRLLATWLVLLGLGLDLASEYAGHGTIHAWVWLLFEALALPLLLLLIVLWRPHIYEELDAKPRLPGWVERNLEHRRGLKGLTSAALGCLYLARLSAQRFFFDAISDTDWGRQILANVYTRELARRSDPGEDVRNPLPAELRDRLTAGSGKLVEKFARSEFTRLAGMVDSGRGGAAVIVADRGGGKTTLLQRLASRFDDQTLIIDCPSGGYEAFREAFAKALGLNADETSPEAFARRLTQSGIRMVAFDNAHLGFRPKSGGEKQWSEIAKLIRAVWQNILWVYAFDRAAWPYISRMRSDRVVLGLVQELPRLNEEQLGDLIDLRSTEAGISPDFTKLVLARRSDDIGQETAAEQNRLSFVRFLLNASDGNPGVALRLWAHSLIAQEDGNIEVRLPEQPSALELERLDVTGLLVLRVIAQCGLATPLDIIQSLRLSRGHAQAVISALDLHGWIEELDGRYRISWPWWRTITRVLARKNILPR